MAFDRAALAVPDFDLFLGRDDHIEDLVLHAHGLDALLKIVAHLVLITRIAMDNIPGSLSFRDLMLDSSFRSGYRFLGFLLKRFNRRRFFLAAFFFHRLLIIYFFRFQIEH